MADSDHPACPICGSEELDCEEGCAAVPEREATSEVSAVSLFETIAEALTELFARVDALEKRPTFAASIKGRSR